MALELKTGMRIKVKGYPATVTECGPPDQVRKFHGYIPGPDAGEMLINALDQSRVTCVAFLNFDDYTNDGALPIILWRNYWWTAYGMRLDDITIEERPV